MSDDPKAIVARGYDAIAERYLAWAGTVRVAERERYTSELAERLWGGAEVLELGCGAGVPTTRWLAEHFRVTGVDISARQIELARQHVPGAAFLQADMTRLDFPPASFDAVAAFYSIGHVPRAEQGPLLTAIARWLRPGGLLVASLGARSTPGAVEPWLGTTMFFSAHDPATGRRLLDEAGFEILSARPETEEEFGEPATFLWVVARRPLTSLQPLFDDPIREQRALEPGYPGHASHVWLVRTDREERVVRTSALPGQPSTPLVGPFFTGLGDLFGTDPRRVEDMAALNARLGRCSPVPVPPVLRTARLDGRTYAVLERLPGRALETFLGQPAALLEQFGRCQAMIHQDRSRWWGGPAGARHELETFHLRAAETVRRQVERFYRDDPTVAPGLEAASQAMLGLLGPLSASPVMPDVDPTQYLWDGQRLTGLVDTEAYVVAPAELELAAVEYLLDRPGADAFERGYRSVAPLPDLRAVRAPYRYLLRVLDAISVDDLAGWSAWPALLGP